MTDSKQLKDVIIIGAGVAGLAAGMYCGRFNMKTVVIGEMPGGIITTTHLVENYPGILSIEGAQMGSVFLEHAQKFGAQLEFSRVMSIERCVPSAESKAPGVFKVKTSSKEFLGKAVIIATGTSHRKLGLPEEKGFNSKGLSYCALCDAAFFKGKTVCVVGGGDAAAIEVLILAEHCKKVYMVVRRDVLRAEPINNQKIMESKNIEVKFNAEIAQIKGEGKVQSVVFKSGEELPMDGIFVAIGFDPLSDLAEKLGAELDAKKQVKIDRYSQTNIPGLFAAGDVTDVAFKQVITGAAQAVNASYFAQQYITKNGPEFYCG
ncbi:MAG: FAD-dependent oxidoreductase [Patescibacteria group bacterium]